MIPADLLLLGSSLQKGHCFIDKANLNGETKLEVLSSLQATHESCRSLDTLKDLHIRITYEPPTSIFDAFRGEMTVKDHTGKESTFNVDGKSLMMRETNLRNCDYIYALVVYTGNETKIQMSTRESGKARLKKSRIMRMVDHFLVLMLVFQFCMCLVAAIWAGIWLGNNRETMLYLGYGADEDSVALTAVFACLSWFILLSNMVPISLIVSAEMVKFNLAFFMNNDLTMYYAPINKKARCNNSTIPEELGMVDYVFSDKTGTLTQNRMEFRYALMTKYKGGREEEKGDDNDQEYGSSETEIARSVQKRKAELDSRTKSKKDILEDDENQDTNDKILKWTQLTLPLHSKLLKKAEGEEEESERDSTKEVDSAELLRRKLTARANFVPETMKDILERERKEQQAARSRRCDIFWRTCWEKSYTDKVIERTIDSEVTREAEVENCFTSAESNTLLNSLWGADLEENETPAMAKERKAHLRNYMRHMALSNTVKPYDDKGELKFQSESAEEDAMCKFARKLGFLKKSQNPTVLEITEFTPDLAGQTLVQEKYLHVATFGFTSKRARVTVLYERLSDNKMVMMTKGQDTMVLPLLKVAYNQEKLLTQLDRLCTNGLRTLVCAEAVIDKEWWTNGREAEYNDIITADESPEQKKRMHDIFEKMEEDAGLGYLGCMGLEDQLQLLVPESIADYLRAGIRVWMITGDKLETAKNIGIACNLIDPDMSPAFKAGQSVEEAVEAAASSRLLEITGQWAKLSRDEEEMKALFKNFDTNGTGVIQRKEMEMCLQALKFTVDAKHVDKVFKEAGDGDGGVTEAQFLDLMRSFKVSMFQAVTFDIEDGIKTYAAIKDHATYPVSILLNRDAFHCLYPNKRMRDKLLDETGKPVTDEQLEELRSKFFLLASVSKSVVFARAEPAMKKKMVTEVMARNPDVITLAIGDGANDTDMIRAAHLGVGIAGIEGTAATNASDYAIGTFRMLHTLIFVHGHWNYIRVSKLVYYIFYKAVMMAMCAYYFGPHSAFSGTQYFNDPPVLMYNIFFTGLPVLFLGIFDKSLNRRTLENNPFAYKALKGTAFTLPIFVGFLFRAFWHAFVLYYLITFSMPTEGGYLYTSTMVMISLVSVASLVIVFDMKSFTFPHFVSILLSFMAVFFLTWFINLFNWNSDLVGVVNHIWAHPAMTVPPMFLAITIPLLVEFALRAWKQHLRPTFDDVLQERIRKQRIAKKAAVAAYREKTESVGDEKKGTLKAAKSELNKLRLQHKPVEVALGGKDQKRWETEIEAAKKKRKERVKKGVESASMRILKIADEVSGRKKQQRDSVSEEESERLRHGMLISMLRFRNRAAGFDSAAQAANQTHDKAAQPKSLHVTATGKVVDQQTQQEVVGEVEDGFFFG